MPIKLGTVALRRSVTGPTPAGSFGEGSKFFGWTGGIAGGAPPFNQLPFNMQKQVQDRWCWSAVAVSISAFYSATSPWTQCSLVCAELGDASCCTNGASSNCNQDWTLNTALQRTTNLVTWAFGALGATDIQTELAATRTIGCRIGWHEGGGHFVAVSGYQNNGTSEDVTVDDPFYGRSFVNLPVFTNAYIGHGSWTHTYFTQA